MKDKELLRKSIWNLLKRKGISKDPFNRIPDFLGSRGAAVRLARTVEWDRADVIFSSPDSAQQPVRELALMDGKDLIMPTPRIKDGYLLINSGPAYAKSASTIKGAYKHGSFIEKFPDVDLVVEGSVAVDLSGNRLGKGGGYGDREIQELRSQGVIGPETPIATTVDEVQVVESVPVESHDEKINMIVTPERVIRLFIDPRIPVVR